MNDRLPGSSYDNPVWYKGYRIYVADCGPFNYQFTHDNYDGAPDANDNRHGHANTIIDAKNAIDEMEQ